MPLHIAGKRGERSVMNPKVEEFLAKKKKEKEEQELKKRNSVLLKLGLCEKEYAPEGKYSSDGYTEHYFDEKAGKYVYIFVDEVHRFRNSDTESFTMLHQICRGKKVVLISATPINNYTSDIENQIYLFQSKQSGTINGIKNIEGFFRGLNSHFEWS